MWEASSLLATGVGMFRRGIGCTNNSAWGVRGPAAARNRRQVEAQAAPSNEPDEPMPDAAGVDAMEPEPEDAIDAEETGEEDEPDKEDEADEDEDHAP